MTWFRWCSIAATAAFGLLSVGCAAGAPSTEQVTGKPIRADALDMMPADSLRSWRDYADQISVVRVTAEHQLPAPAEYVATGEYMIDRTVDLVVEQTLWSRIAPLERVTIGDVGWFYSKDPAKGLRELNAGGLRLRPGKTYLVALTRDPEATTLMTSETAHLVTDGKVTSGPIGEIIGKTPAQIRAQIAALAPNPAVEKYAAFPPGDRNRLVASDRNGSDEMRSGVATTTPDG